MNASSLTSLSGLSLLIGGLATTLGWVGFAVLDPDHTHYDAPTWWLLNGLIIGGGVFIAMGLPGLYARQAAEAGWLGLVGFALLFVGIVIPYVAVHSIETAGKDNIPRGMMVLVTVGAPSEFVGAVLTGIATWSAGVYPRWLAAALIASVLVAVPFHLTRLPPWLGRGLVPALYTIVITVFGFILLS